jgi:hypothetical protein
MELKMKRNLDLIRILFITSIIALLLSGCDFSRIKFGEVRMMYGSNDDEHISYNYSTFTGIENGSALVEAGQTISFDYDVKVDKGSLMIEWQAPDGKDVWQKRLVESDRGNDEIIAQSSGKYTIIIQGKDAGGEFDISWGTQ